MAAKTGSGLISAHMEKMVKLPWHSYRAGLNCCHINDELGFIAVAHMDFDNPNILWHNSNHKNPIESHVNGFLNPIPDLGY